MSARFVNRDHQTPMFRPCDLRNWVPADHFHMELEVQELTTRAEQSDTRATQETLDLPAKLTRREKRLTARKQARQVIEAHAQELTAVQAESYQVS